MAFYGGSFPGGSTIGLAAPVTTAVAAAPVVRTASYGTAAPATPTVAAAPEHALLDLALAALSGLLCTGAQPNQELHGRQYQRALRRDVEAFRNSELIKEFPRPRGNGALGQKSWIKWW